MANQRQKQVKISVTAREVKAISRVLNGDKRGTGWLESDGALRDGVLRQVVSKFEQKGSQ